MIQIDEPFEQFFSQMELLLDLERRESFLSLSHSAFERATRK